ncbi:MAG: hypothetical protein QXW53_06690 [Desulfurococcaceae archaeon]
MIFTKGSVKRAGRLLAVILLLMLAFATSAEARERHSENLVKIARRETEKRYAIAWWLNATGIVEKCPVIDIDNVTPSTATRIYEEVFNRKIELFIGGYQLKYLKLLMNGNDTVEPRDVSLLLESFARSVLEIPGDEYRVLLRKILLSALNPAEREAYKFEVSDIDKLVLLVAELGKKSNVSEKYIFSIIVKLQLVKLATRTGIYEDAYNELLNELLMKESILMALFVDKIVNGLQVNIVEQGPAEVLKLQKQIEQVTRNRPLTRSNVLRVLNYTMEMLQSAGTGDIEIEKLLSVVNIVLSENVDVEYLEEVIQRLGSVAGENTITGAPLTGDRTRGDSLSVEGTESSTGEDDVRMGARRYNHMAGTTEELENAHYYINLAIFETTYLAESLNRLIERINSEKIGLYVEFQDVKGGMVAFKEGKNKSIHIVQGKAESGHLLGYLQYISITLPVLSFLIVAYKKGILMTMVSILKEWAVGKPRWVVSNQEGLVFRSEKAVFFERFWDVVHELSSKYNVVITKSTTHREAYSLLSSRIKDPVKIAVLETLLYGYEYARYGGMELDVKPLLRLIDSLK